MCEGRTRTTWTRKREQRNGAEKRDEKREKTRALSNFCVLFCTQTKQLSAVFFAFFFALAPQKKFGHFLLGGDTNLNLFLFSILRERACRREKREGKTLIIYHRVVVKSFSSFSSKSFKSKRERKERESTFGFVAFRRRLKKKKTKKTKKKKKYDDRRSARAIRLERVQIERANFYISRGWEQVPVGRCHERVFRGD